MAGAVALALLGCAAACRAQVYVGLPHPDHEAVVLSNFPSQQTPILLIAGEASEGERVAAAPTLPARPQPPRPGPGAELAALIGEIAGEIGLSPLLIHAVIAAESNFDPNAVSRKGALGLMQLLPQTAGRFGVRRPFDPRENIRAGAQYLKWLAALFDDRIDLVLAAYNAGEGAVIRAGYRVPELAETRAYVRRVLRGVDCPNLIDCKAAGA